ncbi:SAM-dependent methyltransferase [Streptomyces armeniacus]|nr:SAM-dependent methyltransferase [Streptomyces armeniacus]AXK34299.1 SAM-dependent methyltransferase [Streptomyces armeniacus]
MENTKELLEKMGAIAKSALGSAAIRAQESRREDRLFEDSLAQAFVEESGVDPLTRTAVPESTGLGLHQLVGEFMILRTRFHDDQLLAAARGGRTQVVLLGCGLDSRAFRLDWPGGTRVFENDLAEVLEFKDAALAARGAKPACERVVCAMDLRNDWLAALRDSGFDPERPTVWLAEGILHILPPAAADLLLDRVTSVSAAGSVMSVDRIEDSGLLRTARMAHLDASSPGSDDPWGGGPGAGLEEWFRGRGWDPSVRHVNAVAEEFGRPGPVAFDPSTEGAGDCWLATATLGGA